MKDNLWHIFDFEQTTCDECEKLLACAIYYRNLSHEFHAVCGYCEESWREKVGQ